MRFLYVALLGFCVGAALLANNNNNKVNATSVAASTSLDTYFSSDAPNSQAESNNQGTLDEPAKTWPEANAWLHASLSDTEREFLALSATGPTVGTCPSPNFTATQLADTAATVTVTFSFTATGWLTSQSTLLQKDLLNVPGSSTSSISFPTSSSTSIGQTVGGLTIQGTALTFTFSYNSGASVTAATQYASFVTAWNNQNSALRLSSSFANNIDTAINPVYVFQTVNPTNTPTTATPTTAGSTQSVITTSLPTVCASYCGSHITACLNGGTCIDGTGSSCGAYSCSCASGFIGAQCQWSLNFTSKRRKLGLNGSVRGRSHVQAKTKSV